MSNIANTRDWIELRRDDDTGIETIRAHFEGHAYDPHWHDSYLVGMTEQGVQQFHCRRDRHYSTPGRIFLLEPGEIHDGDAPTPGGFTYRMLYLDPHWLAQALAELRDQTPADGLPQFPSTLVGDPGFARTISDAFTALHQGELRMLRQAVLDDLLTGLSRHLHWRPLAPLNERAPAVALRARDYLHAHVEEDIGLDDLARATGCDRFRLSRAFQVAFGLPPHAYLIQLRLALARPRLARGEAPAQVAASLGFADQSHLGRWFRRAYRLTPARYQRHCSNLPD
ncbi:AraC family transcriptional regulator [Kushneria phosphatilytica]|uniref:AraC family transcriptional regulator n=1 Tax=Kushneria phosphatilytica TaxID=657387 RepID=A0A1S1NSH9_9GAMM|nr:AraC family transcriptional regulator [Kushneria phosphatilytica]OHV08042.1 AraC family transcriptional regulator [Kushneria phosphatilytica]QEL09947.1 AraC family transcriptional regulator [Kushneria phosphatilytica]